MKSTFQVFILKQDPKKGKVLKSRVKFSVWICNPRNPWRRHSASTFLNKFVLVQTLLTHVKFGVNQTMCWSCSVLSPSPSARASLQACSRDGTWLVSPCCRLTHLHTCCSSRPSLKGLTQQRDSVPSSSCVAWCPEFLLLDQLVTYSWFVFLYFLHACLYHM